MMKRAMLCVVMGLMLIATAGSAAAPTAGEVILGTTVEITKAIAVGRRASQLIGAPVQNEHGERIGKIDDFIVAPDNSLSYAIVSVGGFLGIGDRLVSIPVEQLQDQEGKLILPGATKAALEKLPEFVYAS